MNKKLTILYHHRTLGDGAEGIHIAEMVNSFRKEGHVVHMVGPAVGNEGITKQSKKSLFSWVKKIFIGPFYEFAELSYNIFGFMALRKAIKKHQPDLIYDRYITFNYSCIAAGRKYGVPVFLEVNAPLALERDKESDEKLYLQKLAYWLEKKICSDADRTIVVSTPLKKYLTSIGVPGKKIQILPNGVNTEKFYPQPKSEQLMNELGLSREDIVVGFVGILRPWHGIDLLLTAMRDVCEDNQNCKILLVGDGPIRQNIVDLASELNIKDKLIITGRVSHDKVGEYIALFDIAVSPKATFYASPMKIVEYMALGKSVVAPDMENIRDLITDGVDGVLFATTDHNALSHTIYELVVNACKRKELAENALKKVHERLIWGGRIVTSLLYGGRK